MTRRPATPSASDRKHAAILAAAEEVFLRGGGYLGTTMDELARLSGVSKQTVYKHFGSKERLFVELVTSMTTHAGDLVHDDDTAEPGEPTEAATLEPYLVDYAERQLAIVLTPRLLQLRRLVTGEVGRFPELATALYEAGPRRAMTALSALVTRLDARGLLDVDDPDRAAEELNWLIMGQPLNAAMLLGDKAIPPPEALREHAAAAVRTFLAAHGRRAVSRPTA